MQLSHGFHLAYCTNIHRGETWDETFAALNKYTLRVRNEIALEMPYAIGLRLSDRASRDLLENGRLGQFQNWLRDHQCYVFTINGFPYGAFHGARVKEQVYRPDWTTRERVDYTLRLFRILVELLPEGVSGSVSTVPCSFKEFITTPAQEDIIRRHLWECVDEIARLAKESGHDLHLGLEPEPLCYLETTAETALFFQRMQADRGFDAGLSRHLGINYDTCHLAVEFEEAKDAFNHLVQQNIRISKVHLSSALCVRPTAETRPQLAQFTDETYLHQVVARSPSGVIRRYRDLPDALASTGTDPNEEWRIHYHIPLFSHPTWKLFSSTSPHLEAVLDELTQRPDLCSHLEMETYTWDVLPDSFRSLNVVEQLVREYEWTLSQLRARGISRTTHSSQPSRPIA